MNALLQTLLVLAHPLKPFALLLVVELDAQNRGAGNLLQVIRRERSTRARIALMHLAQLLLQIFQLQHVALIGVVKMHLGFLQSAQFPVGRDDAIDQPHFGDVLWIQA